MGLAQQQRQPTGWYCIASFRYAAGREVPTQPFKAQEPAEPNGTGQQPADIACPPASHMAAAPAPTPQHQAARRPAGVGRTLLQHCVIRCPLGDTQNGIVLHKRLGKDGDRRQGELAGTEEARRALRLPTCGACTVA